VIALSVAAALAIFVVYTALAGAGVAQLTPSTISAAKGNVILVGQVVGPIHANGSHLAFAVKDIRSADPARVRVDYSGSVPDLFKRNAEISVTGAMHHGRFAATPDSLTTKCPDHYGPAKSSSNT
jgi:cytochrome c-type biogenesis protein CcmE